LPLEVVDSQWVEWWRTDHHACWHTTSLQNRAGLYSGDVQEKVALLFQGLVEEISEIKEQRT
jgi:hypothetical protein